jgi:four helix bundle protein
VSLNSALQKLQSSRTRNAILWSFLGRSGGEVLVADAGVSDSLICDRSFEFTCRILPLAGRLWDRGPVARQIAYQLMKCGPSIGANAEEAQDGQTKPDFIAKLSISRKESRETRYWLRVAVRVGVVTADQVAWGLKEVGELRAMIVAAIKTAQSSADRGSP